MQGGTRGRCGGATTVAVVPGDCSRGRPRPWLHRTADVEGAGHAAAGHHHEVVSLPHHLVGDQPSHAPLAAGSAPTRPVHVPRPQGVRRSAGVGRVAFDRPEPASAASRVAAGARGPAERARRSAAHHPLSCRRRVYPRPSRAGEAAETDARCRRALVDIRRRKRATAQRRCPGGRRRPAARSRRTRHGRGRVPGPDHRPRCANARRAAWARHRGRPLSFPSTWRPP